MFEPRTIVCLLSALLIGVQGTVCCCVAGPPEPPEVKSKAGASTAGMTADHSCCESSKAPANAPTRQPQRDGKNTPCPHGKCNLGAATSEAPATALALNADGPLVYVIATPVELPVVAAAEGALSMIRRGPPPYHGDSLYSLACLLTI